MPNNGYFLHKKSLLDRFKDAHGGHTGYIQSARAKRTWHNPITRHKRTKSLNGWIDSFQGRHHIRKLSRFNALRNESYEELDIDTRAMLDRIEDSLAGMYHLDWDDVHEYVVSNLPEMKALCYSDELSEVKRIKLAYAGYQKWAEESGMSEKLSYEKGHKDSKGGDAPWVIRSHEDNRVLASFANKGDAEEHMKRMMQYSKDEANKERAIPEKTLQTVMANLVCLGKPGKAMQNYTASRRREIFDELEKRGWLEPNSIVPSSKGKELAKDWVGLCQEDKKSEKLVISNPCVVYKGDAENAAKAHDYLYKKLPRVKGASISSDVKPLGNNKFCRVLFYGNNTGVMDLYIYYSNLYNDDFWNNCDADPQGWVDPRTIAKYDVATPRQESKESAEYTVHSYNDTDVVHYEDGTPEEWRCKRCGGLEGGEDGEPFGYYITNSKGKTIISPLCADCVDDACDILNTTHGNINKALGLSESKDTDEKLDYEKGHKNSRGENAPWVIRSHEDNRILASFSNKKDAEEHLKRMKQYSKTESRNSEALETYACYIDFETEADAKQGMEIVKGWNPVRDDTAVVVDGLGEDAANRLWNDWKRKCAKAGLAISDGGEVYKEEPSNFYGNESKKSETTGNGGINTDDAESVIRDLGLEIINTWYDGDRSRTVYDVRDIGDEFGEVACVWVESPYEARVWLKDANPRSNGYVEGITGTDELRTELARILGIATDESIEEASTPSGYRNDVLSELDVSWHYGMDGASRLGDKYANFIRDSYGRGESAAETAHMIARADGNIYAVESRVSENGTDDAISAFKGIADSLGISGRADVHPDGDRVVFSLKLDIPDLESYEWEYDPRGKVIKNAPDGARKRVNTLDDAVSWLKGDIEELLGLEKESKLYKDEGFTLEQVDTIRVPQWLWIAYVNDDPSGLEDDEMDALSDFREKYRDYHLDDRGEEAYFSSRNDFDSLGGNVYDVDVYRRAEESHKKSESLKDLGDFPAGTDYMFTSVVFIPKLMQLAKDTATEMGIPYEQDKDVLGIWTKSPSEATRFVDRLIADASAEGIPERDIRVRYLILASAIKRNAGYENDKESIDETATQFGVSVEPMKSFDGIFVKGEFEDVVDFFEALR